MSFGLSLAQGLIGGFTKNIEREQDARISDDQRMADLQNMFFQGTMKSAQDGTPMPKQIGDQLKKAKLDMAESRKKNPIGAFGMGKSDPLSLDMAELSGTLNGIGGSYFDLGGLKIPMNPLYAKEKNLGVSAKLFLEGINKYASVPEQLQLMKDKLTDKNVASYFNGKLTTEKGLYKALIGKLATASGANKIVSIPMVGGSGNQFNILSEFDYLKEVDIDGTEQTINVARDKLFGKEGTGVFEKNRKSHLVLPFKTSDGKNDFFTFKLKSNDMQALQRIAEINGEKDSSVFISKFRKSIGRAAPTLDDRFVDAEEMRKFFPSVFHSIELEKLGASLNLSEINQEEKQQILNYMNTKVGLNIGDRVRALAPLMKLEKNQQVSLIQSIEGFSSPTGGDLAEKDKFFFDAVGLSQKDFDEKFLATEATTNDLDKLMGVEGDLNTTPGGLARTLQQFFGSITVTTGVADQLSNIFSSGKNKDDVTEETLMERVQKIKDEPGNNIATALADMSKSESIMIALAANMARAVDPSGRLSNQDFEVQLRRLGASGFFRSKVAQVSQLQNVMTDFKGRLERIKMIKKVREDAKTRNFNSREFQILNANSKLDNLMGGLQAGASTEGGTPKIVYDEGLTFPSKRLIGSGGEEVLIKTDPNGKRHYFINGEEVGKQKLKGKGTFAPDNNKIKDDKIKNDKNIGDNKEAPNSSTSVKGTYLSGNNVSGMTLVDPDGNKLPGLYIQRNGKFIKKPEGEGA